MAKAVGVSRDDIENYLKKYGSTISLATIATVFGYEAVEKIIKAIVIAILTRYLGKEAAKKIIQEIAKRVPWWAEWIGPVMWVISGFMFAIDVFGPAYRKTVPSILYIGIALMRIEKSYQNDIDKL